MKIVQEFIGSSYLLRAHGKGGASATILSFLSAPPPEKIAGGFQQAGKKEGGWGEGIFARLLSAEGGMGWESVSAIPALAGRQNRKIFVSLIEKNFGGRRLKKCRENFSVLLPPLAEAETLGGIQSAKSSGFCSKKVRISSSKHHHNEFEECSASPSPSARASAGSFASKSKGFLKSISSRSAARRRFINEICIARRAMSRFFSFVRPLADETQSKILLNCRCGVSFFNYN